MKDQAKLNLILTNRNLNKRAQARSMPMINTIKNNLEEKLMAIDHIHLHIIWD